MATLTLANLISYVASAYGQTYLSGTADSGSTTTLVDDALIACGYSLVGHQILLGASPEQRRITAFNDVTGTVTFTPAGTAVTGSTIYEILPLPKAEFIGAINKAIRAAGRDFGTVRYTTVSLSPGQQDYNLATDVVCILAAWIASLPEASSIEQWIPFHEFDVLENEGLKRINLRTGGVFNPNLNYSHTLRYSYLALPEILTATTDDLEAGAGTPNDRTSEVPLVSFVEEYALHLLHEKALQLNPTGEVARMHATLSQNHQRKAEDVRKRSTGPRVTRSVRRRALPIHA
jgi:hypothetical protein